MNNSKVQLGGNRKQALKISHPTNLKNLDKETQILSVMTPGKEIEEKLNAVTRALKGPTWPEVLETRSRSTQVLRDFGSVCVAGVIKSCNASWNLL